MIDTKYLQKLKKGVLKYAEVRRNVITTSDEALHHAKRAIFALHRDDLKEARKKIRAASKLLKSVGTKYKKEKRVFDEGSYKAALEEYVEAVLFYHFITKQPLGHVNTVDIPDTVYLAGLLDVPGELYRYAVKAATNKDTETVERCAYIAGEILGELIEFNLTSYLRTKFDQAKNAVRKLEQVVYELSLRQ